jgi:GNAT superfamily N-acetyltransferase
MVRLDSQTNIGSFDCGSADLNEFLLEDALHYSSNLLAVTYLFKNQDDVFAFLSVSNDKIHWDEKIFGTRSQYYKVLKDVPSAKRLNTMPAVKLARLGVSLKYKRYGLGTQIIDRMKVSFTTKNKTGCRFITVDAYKSSEATEFYQKNGFKFLTNSDQDRDTRLMYFDLKWYVNFLNKMEAAKKETVAA